MHLGIAFLVGCIIVYFVYPIVFPPRLVRREGFQPAPDTLVGDAGTCEIMKNILVTINSRLEKAKESNNPSELNIINTSKDAMEKQYAALKCT